MLTDKTFTYYQPSRDGSLPAGLYSFQAFVSKEACNKWLSDHTYTPPEDWDIIEYHDDDIEEVTLIDADGITITRRSMT